MVNVKKLNIPLIEWYEGDTPNIYTVRLESESEYIKLLEHYTCNEGLNDYITRPLSYPTTLILLIDYDLGFINSYDGDLINELRIIANYLEGVNNDLSIN